jgi:putative mRNA 3-end processing factor
MDNSLIDISCNGAIVLGPHVTCDGFVSGYDYRVQTHVHEDHMSNFDCSKGFQTIIMSHPTRALLELRHADLGDRVNVVSLPEDGTLRTPETEIQMLPSGHMLGAVQVAVTGKDGARVGYSGDFSWPLERVIQVERLVVDSTYGSPGSIRRYSQEDADDCLKETILNKIKIGSVIVKGHRGTLYRAFELLYGLVPNPIIANRRTIDEAMVCRRYGGSVCQMEDLDLPEVKQLRKDGPYVGLYRIGEHVPFDHGHVTVITLTAEWVHGKEPILELSDSSYQIALSDHADFDGTMEYVRATGAREVLTDSVHGAHAIELASAIRGELGIKARPANPLPNKNWGA